MLKDASFMHVGERWCWYDTSLPSLLMQFEKSHLEEEVTCMVFAD